MVTLFAEQDRKVHEVQHFDLDLVAAMTEIRQAYAITDQARQTCMDVKTQLKDIMLEALKVFVLKEDQIGEKTRTANAMKKSFSPLVTQLGQLIDFSLTPTDDSTNLECMKALFDVCTNREHYETIVDVCIGADTLQKAAEAIESNGVVFKKTSMAVKSLMPTDFFKSRIGWLVPSSDINHEAMFSFVGEMHSRCLEAKKQVEHVSGKAMMTLKAALENTLSTVEFDSKQDVANTVKLDKQHLADMCALAKSQLEAFGATDVFEGQEKSEVVSIIASCDELLTKTESGVFRWGVETLLGDSRIGAVEQGEMLRKSSKSMIVVFPDAYDELEEKVLVQVSRFRTYVRILDQCAPHTWDTSERIVLHRCHLESLICNMSRS